MNNYRVCLYGQGCRHWADVVFAVVVHDVVGCDKGWHISPCFLWKERVDLPIVLFAFGAVYGFVDVFRPSIVCGNNKVPVPEYAIEVTQVVCGCERRFCDVAAFVDERVNG